MTVIAFLGFNGLKVLHPPDLDLFEGLVALCYLFSRQDRLPLPSMEIIDVDFGGAGL